jgi:hypothetical protein
MAFSRNTVPPIGEPASATPAAKDVPPLVPKGRVR